MADRKENIENEDIVVWHTFGLTHNPRIEGQLFPIRLIQESVG
jgi:primary-amine oxidase